MHCRKHKGLITNASLLKRRTNATAEQDSEAERQQRSSNRNARKSIKEARLQNKAKYVVHLLTSSTLTLDELNKRENHAIHLADINNSCQLVARFHFKAMIWLIENGYFSSDVLEYANKPHKILASSFKKEKIRLMQEKEFATKRCQRTLFDCF